LKIKKKAEVGARYKCIERSVFDLLVRERLDFPVTTSGEQREAIRPLKSQHRRRKDKENDREM